MVLVEASAPKMNKLNQDESSNWLLQGLGWKVHDERMWVENPRARLFSSTHTANIALIGSFPTSIFQATPALTSLGRWFRIQAGLR